MFHYTLELISAFDLIGDIYCLRSYIITGHYFWSSFTIFTMICPYFISYVPLVNFWLLLGSFGIYSQEGKEQKIPCGKKILGYLALFPIFLVYLFLMDLIYVIHTILCLPFLLVIKCITFGRLNVFACGDWIENSYQYLFDMGPNEIEGFRRLRTISQLIFEGIPQIFLLIRVYIYF